VHRNARLNLHGRRLLVARIGQGRPIAHVAHELGISRQTAYKWWGRWRRQGDVGLLDRSSRPRRCPARTPRVLERRVEQLRRSRKLGPARIAGILEIAASTVHRILCRQGLNRLAWLDRPSAPSSAGASNTAVPANSSKSTSRSWVASPPAVDGVPMDAATTAPTATPGSATRSSTPPSTATADSPTAKSFQTRRPRPRSRSGTAPTLGSVISGSASRSPRPTTAPATGHAHSPLPSKRPARSTDGSHPADPPGNGKVERFNRTLLDEWAYVRIYRTDAARTAALERWLHLYNHHRSHTSLAGQAPITRVNKLSDQHN
jgi:transposase